MWQSRLFSRCGAQWTHEAKMGCRNEVRSSAGMDGSVQGAKLCLHNTLQLEGLGGGRG